MEVPPSLEGSVPNHWKLGTSPNMGHVRLSHQKLRDGKDDKMDKSMRTEATNKAPCHPHFCRYVSLNCGSRRGAAADDIEASLCTSGAGKTTVCDHMGTRVGF